MRIRSWESCNGVKSNERSRQSCGSLEEQSKRADQAVLRSRPCRMDRMVCPLASSAIPSEGVVKAKNGYPHTTERVRARYWRGTVQCACAADVRQVGARRSLNAPPRCPEARLPQIQPALHRRAGALEVRYRGAAGGAEKAHTRQRRWCLWSKGNR